MDRYAADRTVKRLARRAGITKRISRHGLRHSFITCALDAGVALRDVQDAPSHADPRTTMRYDRGRGSLDRPATYIVATFLAGASRSPGGLRFQASGRSTSIDAHRLRSSLIPALFTVTLVPLAEIVCPPSTRGSGKSDRWEATDAGTGGLPDRSDQQVGGKQSATRQVSATDVIQQHRTEAVS